MSEPTSDSALAVLGELSNSAGALINLLFLIERDRNDPDKVLLYVRMADEAVKKITNLTVQARAWQQKSNNTTH